MSTNLFNSPDYSGSSSSGSYGINTKIMIAAVVVLFMVVVFILLLHIYARWFWRRGRMAAARRRRRMRFDFAASEGIRSAQHTGLDQAILSTLPTFVYSKDKMGEDGYDCAVCLSEFEENESGTLIPQCNHRFHTSCIDMWFHSHSTCPLCRRSLNHHSGVADPAIILHIESGPRTPDAEFNPNMAIQQQQQQQQQQHHEQQHIVSAQNASQCSPNGVQYPPNVLFWGRANEGLSESNSTKQPSQPSPHHLAIDIPRSSSTFSFTSDSPRSPLRSIRRLLSRDKRINHIEPGSPSCNVEDCSVQSDPSSHLPTNPSK